VRLHILHLPPLLPLTEPAADAFPSSFAVLSFFASLSVLSTENLGRHTRRAAGLLVMGVAGGAAFPPVQGAIAGTVSTRTSMWLSFPAFLYVAGFSFWCWMQKGRKFTRKAESAWVANQLAARSGADLGPSVPAGGATSPSIEALEDEKKVINTEEAHLENVSYNRV
jgi:hypothetical protein